MKYIFKNIGPIKNAELELGDLTIIAGGNNTGKTYIAYALYGLRKHLHRSREPARAVYSLNMRQMTKRYQNKFSDTENQGGIIKGSVPSEILMQFAREHTIFLSELFSRGGISDVFSAPREKFFNPSVTVAIEETDLPKGFSVSETIDGTKITLSEKNGSVKYEVEFNANNTIALESPLWASRSAHVLLVRAVSMVFFKITPDFISPAERFGISLFYKELDFAKSRLVEALQKWSDTDKKHQSRTPLMLGRESARYGLPISDHIDWTRNLDRVTKQTSPLSENKIFDNIKKMMGGSYRHDENQTFFVSRAIGKNRYNIPLHMASSSARELSSLYFYLKHQASPNGLIIVDEPESHLDTENQIQMARLLAQCVNLGMRVLITTHSDYIVQELNNMIMLHSVTDKEKIRQLCKKQGYNEHHFLDKSKVKGYLCQDGKLASCTVDNRGMDLQWFDKTIEQINSVSYALDGCIPEDSK